MKKTGSIIIVTFTLLIPVSIFCQKCDTIPWSKHRELNWRYFKAMPDNNNNVDALSDVSIFYEISITQHLAKFIVGCNFHPCSSWIKGTPSIRLLQHEQTHFDIAEYHRRLLVKEIINRKYTTDNLKSSVEEFGKTLTSLRKFMDDEYDLETAHSVNDFNQREWTRKIDKLLKKMDLYEGVSFILTLN